MRSAAGGETPAATTQGQARVETDLPLLILRVVSPAGWAPSLQRRRLERGLLKGLDAGGTEPIVGCSATRVKQRPGKTSQGEH